MIHEVLLFAAVFAASAAAPGADTMLLFARSMAAGPRAAAPLAVGITAAKLVLLAAAAAGVSAAAAALGPVFIAVKVAGAAYLLWLGIKMWRRPPAATKPAASATPPVGPVRAVATGFVLGVSNPQAIVFYLALLPAVITPGAGVGLYSVLAVALCAVMAIVATAYIALGARARRAAASPTARRRADRIAGTVLIGSGVLVATR